MTDPKRDSEANRYLTKSIHEKTDDTRLQVERIRWENNETGTVSVKTKIQIHESSFVDNEPVIIHTGIRNPGESKSCLDKDVLDAIADNWPVDHQEKE